MTHDQIKSLHDSGMGYRQIAKHLNQRGIKTIRGNEWGTNNVYSILKRNMERLKRLEIRKQETDIEYGKMELVWLSNKNSILIQEVWVQVDPHHTDSLSLHFTLLKYQNQITV